MISREDVLALAGLARLTLADTEVEALQKDISSILDYVGQVTTAATEKSSLSPQRTVMREDLPRDARHLLNDKEEALRAAFPTREGAFNAVRKILEKDE